MNIDPRSLELDPAVHDRVVRRLRTLESTGSAPSPAAPVLDLGCGGGDAVSSLIAEGFDAFGCDLRFREGRNTARLEEAGRIRTIELEPYRLPFDDDSFDLVLSDQVFEHVADYASTIAEIARVTRPGGVGLHIFPPRWSVREVHLMVPLAGAISDPVWLRLWASLGVRNVHQRGLPVDEVVQVNRRYLAENVNYLSGAEIDRAFRRGFTVVENVEREFLARGRRSASLVRPPLVGGIASALYRELRMRAILTRDPLDAPVAQ